MSLQLRITFICLAAILYCAVAEENNDIDAKTLAVIKRESLIAASAIRNITIRTPQCKVQIASIASDFMVALNYAQYSLNNVIPNIVGDENYIVLASTARIIGDLTNDIQKATLEGSEELKEILGSTLEKLNEAVIQFEKDFKNVSNNFINTQVKRKHDFIIYALYKISAQARLFDVPNNQLEPKMGASIDELIDTVNSLSVFDKTSDAELRHILQHLAIITERNVYKLGNWIEVNCNNTEGVKIVRAASLYFSELYEKQTRAASEDRTAMYMKVQLINILETGLRQGNRLSRFEYDDNLGGQEFIRSILFDCIAIGKAYSENIKKLNIGIQDSL